MQVDRSTVFFLIIMFVFLSLPSGNDKPHSTKEQEILENYHQDLTTAGKELTESTYSSGYGNITGFKLSYDDNLGDKNISKWPFRKYDKKHPWKEDEKNSILPNEVSNSVKKFWSTSPVEGPDDTSYSLNITGKLFGEFEISGGKKSLKKYDMKPPKYMEGLYQSDTDRDGEEDSGNDKNNEKENSTGKVGDVGESSGKVILSLRNYDYNYKSPELSPFIKNKTTDSVGDAVVVTARLYLSDYGEVKGHEIDTTGVYFQKSGSLVTVTKSAKFFGMHGLPHLSMNDENFGSSKLLMGQLINTTDIERDLNMDSLVFNLAKSQDHCEFISYFQLKKTDYTREQLEKIENELSDPTGTPLPKDLPELEVSDFLIYSPDCGIVLKKNDKSFAGSKIEVSNRKFKTFLTGVLVLVCIQLAVVLRQMKQSRTPGQLSLISSRSLLIIGFYDGILAMTVLLASTLGDEIYLSVSVGNLYLLLTCIAVISFITIGSFEVRFMGNVMSTQANEQGTSWWEILRGNSNVTDEAQNSRPSPVDSGDESRITNNLMNTGLFFGFFMTFVIVNSTTWRVIYRRIFEYVCTIIFNSFWIPQFFRNTLKNRRTSFTWEFLIATTLVRLVPIVYLCLDSRNPLRHHKDPILAVVAISWLGLQLFLLFLQRQLGARFWVNDKWLPKAYDYQPTLNLHDLENGFASDILANIKTEPTESNSVIECKVDCAICMSEIQLQILASAGVHSSVTHKDYMVTPCHHIFHKECLEDWMRYKLQCPVCRNGLPPT